MVYTIIVNCIISMVLHGTFNKEQSQMLIKLWQPQTVPLDSTVFVNDKNVEKFIKARLILENMQSFAIGNLENSEINIYLCTQPSKNIHQIEFCLWSSDDTNKCKKFNDLNEWHNNVFNDCILRVGNVDKETKDAWFSK